MSIQTGKAPVGSKYTSAFSAQELFEVLQAAIVVKLFEAKHHKKGDMEKELGEKIRGAGICRSDKQFKS